MLLKKYLSLALLLIIFLTVAAQETKKDVNTLTREEVLNMTIEELAAYDLEEVMKLMDIVGASTIEELYELLLNKDVTSASKSEESLFDSPLSTTVLSHDQIITSGATSIEEALRLVPGLIVREKTNGNFDVHIRGNDNLPGKNMLLYSENSQTLVMINGRPVFNYSHGGTLWESLPIGFEDINRIEVVRGPSSALYGANAVSGVINIITEGITKESALVSGNIKAGNLSSYIGDIAFRKKLSDKVGVGITANYETRKRENDKIYVYNGIGQNPTTGEYYEKYRLDDQTKGNGYYSMDELRKLYVVDDPNTYKVFPEPGESGNFENGLPITIYGPDDIYLHSDKAKERYALNGYLEFSPNKNTNINLNGGFQHSDVLTSTMGDMPTPYSGKISKTAYIDLRANIKDISIQANYNGGDIDFMTGNEGFELDLRQYNASADYNLKLDKIDIRPGINYQHISYDDSPYILAEGRGYLNGKKDIEIYAGSLRLDYKPTDKLRLIAALRTEKYNQPDELYTSWQFVGSYKINDNNIFRAVYSRANQSSFLVNAHSNYTWNLVNRSFPKIMQFNGNKEYDLLTSDMIEIGYRIRPAKNILVDLEAFYNASDNFGALMPKSTSLAVFNPLEMISIPNAIPNVNGIVNMEYLNTGLESKQIGTSVNVDWVINEKLVANAHLTYQQTKLDNYNKVSRDEVIGYQAMSMKLDPDLATKIGAALQAFGAGVLGGTIDPTSVDYVVASEMTEYPNKIENDYTHKSTPSYFGGFSLTYRPTAKWEIFPQAYYYGKQTFENQYDIIDIDSKFIFNTKVAFKATDNLTLHVTGKNLFGNNSTEFAYMDKIPTMVFAGLNFKF